MINPRRLPFVEPVEVPGCPNGSLFVVSYLMERRPRSAKFLVPDSDCVAVLRFILPHMGYSHRVARREKGWLVEVEKAQ